MKTPNETAIVTGAAGGIGHAIASRLVRDGAWAVAMDNAEACKDVAQAVNRATGTTAARAFYGDVMRREVPRRGIFRHGSRGGCGAYLRASYGDSARCHGRVY